jgi:Ca-activated chloride channel family protein
MTSIGRPFLFSPVKRLSGRMAVFSTAVLIALLTFVLPAQQQTFKTGARSVAVHATVTGKDGRLVPDLVMDDFEIKDEGKVQPISVFSNEVQPISVVVMLDRSGSMRGNAGLVGVAARAFVGRLEGADKARIGVFADRVEIQPAAFTNDRDELLRVLQSDMPVTGASPLWNALEQAIIALRGQEGRRVVLVFSDGGDSPANFSFNNRSIMDVMRRAQQENVMVYAIGLSTTVLRGRSGGGIGAMTGSMTSVRPDPGLSMVAEDTGGGYFELSRAENLATTFADVADELHHQYALAFEPAKLDDKMHELEVKVKKSGMKVRARKEYFAAK